MAVWSNVLAMRLLAREFEGRSFATDDGEEQCLYPKCSEDAGASQGQRLCSDHFIAIAYEQLKRCEEQLSIHTENPALFDVVKTQLSEIGLELFLFCNRQENLSRVQKTQLLDLLFWRSQLTSRIRSSSRVVASMQVRLLCGDAGSEDEEVTTRVFSKKGCVVDCGHKLKPEDGLFLERIDTGHRAPARVVWCTPVDTNRWRAGIEIRQCDNFWGLAWEAAGKV